MVEAVFVLEQARSADVFDLEDRTSPQCRLSFLSTALSRLRFREFLGLRLKWMHQEPEENPVPAERLEALSEQLVCIYGSKSLGDDPIVRTTNPDQGLPAYEPASEEGLTALLNRRDLQLAWETAQPQNARFRESLYAARRNLHDAPAALKGCDGREAPPRRRPCPSHGIPSTLCV